MEKHWFIAPAPRKSRTLYTVVGSVVLHGSIIAVAALWPVREAAPVNEVITVITEEPSPGEMLPLPPSATEANLTPPTEPEPPPLAAEASTDTPPPSDEPDMAEPVPPKPAPKTPVNKARPVRSSLPDTAHGQPGAVNTARGTVGAAGAGHPGATGRWNTPQPPYPYAMRAARVQGSGSVRITTDASGRVVSVSVTQSTGNPRLDANTSQFARTNWSGPPNASITVPITYQMR